MANIVVRRILKGVDGVLFKLADGTEIRFFDKPTLKAFIKRRPKPGDVSIHSLLKQIVVADPTLANSDSIIDQLYAVADEPEEVDIA